MSSAFVFAGVESDADGQFVSDDAKPLACRGCLTMERPLRPLDRSQASLYQQLTGTTVSRSDIYPKFLCSYCRALLLKFSEFRSMCLSVQETLLKLSCTGTPITTDLLSSGLAGEPFPKLQAVVVQRDSYEPAHIYIDIMNDETNSSKPIKKEGMCVEFEPEYITIDTNINGSTSSHITRSPIVITNTLFSSDLDEDEKPVLVDQGSFSDHDEEYTQPMSEESDTNEESTCSISDLKKSLSKNRNMNKKRTKQTDDEDPIHMYKTKSKNNMKQNTQNKNMVKEMRSSKYFEDVSSNIENDNEENKSKLDSYFERRRANSERKFNVKYVPLSKEDQIKQIEARKLSVNYKLAIYKCDICYRGFRMELAYKNHMILHDQSRGDYLCEVCSMCFPTRRELAQHEYLSHRYDLVCNECGHVTKTSCNAAIHYRKHRGIKYPCKVCGKSFDKPNRVWDHMNVCHEGALACSICDDKFIGPNGLRVHMNRAHKEAAGAVCALCDVQFHSHDALRRHLPQDGIGSCDHTHRPCAACGEGFPTEELLQQHKQEQHVKSFKCTVCDKILHSKVKYRNHVNNHITQNRMKLSEQLQLGSLNSEFRRVVEKSLPVFVCEICGFNVKNSRQALEKHRRTHTGEKLFQCDICQKRFTTKRYLGIHTDKHKGIVLPTKTYLCRICEKPFNHLGNRDKHEKAVHQKLRPFECSICEKKFHSKDAMQNHVMHTHRGVPWPRRTHRRRNPKST